MQLKPRNLANDQGAGSKRGQKAALQAFLWLLKPGAALWQRTVQSSRGGARNLLLIAVAAITAVAGLAASHAVVRRLEPATAAPNLVADLSGAWEVCLIPKHGKFHTEGCIWQKHRLPGGLSDFEGNFEKRVAYRKKFSTPDFCREKPCSFIFGELANAGTISVNGHKIGEGGLFPAARSINRRYPIAAPIPGWTLSPDGLNSVVVLAFASSPKYAGPYEAPVGIMDGRSAEAFVRAHMTGTVFMPLATVLGLVLIAGLVCVFALTRSEDVGLPISLCIYCLVNAFFLISFADVAYESMPMRYAVPWRYVLRRANDASLMGIIVFSVAHSGIPRRLAVFSYWCAGIICAAGSLWVIGGALQSEVPSVEIVEMTQNTIRITWPVKFLAPAGAFVASLISIKSRSQRPAAAALAALLLALAYDSAVFWHLPHTDFATRFHSLVLCCVVAGLIIKKSTRKAIEDEMKAERAAALDRTARQVAHDIRSPLAALTMIARHAAELPEEQRVMVRGAVNRINDITNTLISKNENRSAKKYAESTVSLYELLEMIATESRVARRGQMQVNIEFASDADSFGLFSSVNPVELKRVISNIMNNAVESIDGTGNVILSLHACAGHARVQVRDTGRGMSAERLSRLGTAGATFDKPGGSGLGIHHAKNFLEESGGSLTFASELTVGTTATIKVPTASPPSWFFGSLNVGHWNHLVILDDDSSVHRIWERRIQDSIKSEIRVTHLFSEEELRTFLMDSDDPDSFIFLADYELLGGGLNGVECLKKYNLMSRSVLVTSRAEEPHLQETCTALGLPLLPKSMVSLVPIILIESIPHGTVDIVLIDDDEMMHKAWKMIATGQGKRLISFTNFNGFSRSSASLPRDIPVYVDYNLQEGTGINGAIVSKQVFEMGFERVYIATGESPKSLPPMPWISGVVGKDVPSQWCAAKQESAES